MQRYQEPPTDYESSNFAQRHVGQPTIHLDIIQEADYHAPSQNHSAHRDSGNESSTSMNSLAAISEDRKRKKGFADGLSPKTLEGLLSQQSSRVPSRVQTPCPSKNGSRRNSDAVKQTLGEESPESTQLSEIDASTSTSGNEAQIPVWDIFKKTPKRKVVCNTEKCFLTLVQIAKFMTYIVLSGGILLTAMASKASLLLLTERLGTMSRSYITELDGLVYLLLLGLCIPHCLSFLLSAAKAWFGNVPRPSWKTFFFVLCLETCHSAGQTYFVMYVMPRLAPLETLTLLLAVGQVPALINFVCYQEERRAYLKRIIDGLALTVQIFVVVCLFFQDVFHLQLTRPLLNKTVELNQNTTVHQGDSFSSKDISVGWLVKLLTELSLLVLSIRWWESFACKDITFRSRVIPLRRFAAELYKTRAKTHLFVSLWKIAITVLVTFAIFGRLGNMNKVFKEWYSNMQFPIHTTTSEEVESEILLNTTNSSRSAALTVSLTYPIMTDWVLVGPFLSYMFSSWILYHCATVACKLRMQTTCFAVPLLFATPLSLVLTAVMCTEFPSYLATWESYIMWECVADNGSSTFITMGIGLLWGLSTVWITRHIWFSHSERLAFTDRLFVTPVFDPLLLDQSFLFARRKDDNFDRKEVTRGDNVSAVSAVDSPRIAENEPNTVIYICATMWHENVNEMIQMLKSVFRLDRDQSKRRNFRDIVIDYKDPDYYDFEAHIFFDDAMDLTEAGFSQPNGFVKQLVSVIHQAASEIHGKEIKLDPPTKMVTPYGGRLEWSLPGENKIVAHLKDKNKIRHRKRWSQVMYMYYFLGYRMLLDVDSSALTASAGNYESIIEQLPSDVKLKAENTYLLALDGDVDFKPEAVLLLVDMMKKNKQVGAACGRIKPIGSGPVMWYQKFEYAIGHWLQKAAEHTYGCVLCSPGCFSLFRGLALMDNNVMRTYATKPTEARHYLQYDQGEDRWLCTLLLQQGYKIEYCAAADALTYVPETFQEFFNQRRRWGPSTTANIMDLLGSYRETVKINPNISYLYMFYQFVMLASSLLGPATVLLMVQTSLHAVFSEIPQWASYSLTFGPTLTFVVVCFKCKANTQLAVAAIFSTLYALVMMAVIAGTVVNVIQDGWYTPNAIFLYIVIGVFVIAALLHPTEMFDLLWGVLYFLCVPSTFIYLMVYSICNLNVVSWGTREVKKPVIEQDKQQGRSRPADQDNDPIAQAMEEIKNQKQTKLSGLASRFNIFGGQVRTNNMVMLAFLQTLKEMRSNSQPSHGVLRPRPRQRTSSTSSMDQRAHHNGANEGGGSETDSEDETIPDDWTKDPQLGDGREETLGEKETQFFEGLIERYLYPLSGNKEEEAKISADLIELRNNVSFAFFMLNGLWLVIMIALQEVKSFVNITIIIDEDTTLKLEPLGLLFLTVFAIILVLQFAAMLMHRYATFTHILSTTELFQCRKQQTMEEMSKTLMQTIDAMQSDNSANLQLWTAANEQMTPIPSTAIDMPPDYSDAIPMQDFSSYHSPPDYDDYALSGRMDTFNRNRTLRGNFRQNFLGLYPQLSNGSFQRMPLEVLVRKLDNPRLYSEGTNSQYRY